MLCTKTGADPEGRLIVVGVSSAEALLEVIKVTVSSSAFAMAI